MNTQTTPYARYAGYWLHNGKGSLVVFHTTSRSKGMVKFAKQDGTGGYLSADEADAMVEGLTQQGFKLMNSYGIEVQARGRVKVETTDGVVITFTGSIKLFEGHSGWAIEHEVSGKCLDEAYSAFYKSWNSASLSNIDLCDAEGNRFPREAFGFKIEKAALSSRTSGFAFARRM